MFFLGFPVNGAVSFAVIPPIPSDVPHGSFSIDAAGFPKAEQPAPPLIFAFVMKIAVPSEVLRWYHVFFFALVSVNMQTEGCKELP